MLKVWYTDHASFTPWITVPLPLEAPHTRPSASGPISPLPSCKQATPLSPLFASLTKSVHPIDSTPLTHPLFSTTCALFRALCQERNAISFPFNRFRTLARKHPGVGVAATLIKGGGGRLSPLEPILTQKQAEGVGASSKRTSRANARGTEAVASHNHPEGELVAEFPARAALITRCISRDFECLGFAADVPEIPKNNQARHQWCREGCCKHSL